MHGPSLLPFSINKIIEGLTNLTDFLTERMDGAQSYHCFASSAPRWTDGSHVLHQSKASESTFAPNYHRRGQIIGCIYATEKVVQITIRVAYDIADTSHFEILSSYNRNTDYHAKFSKPALGILLGPFTLSFSPRLVHRVQRSEMPRIIHPEVKHTMKPHMMMLQLMSVVPFGSNNEMPARPVEYGHLNKLHTLHYKSQRYFLQS